MNTSVQGILRILHAASGFIPDADDAVFYVVVEESNELSELRWVGSQLASETLIASDIRTNSSAVYAAHDDTVSVFCVGENNALRLFTLKEDEWKKGHLSGNGEILVHPSGRLSGSVYGADSLVFFEDMSGRIRGIRVEQDGRWRFLRSFSVDSVPGNPHFAQVSGDTVYLSYVNRDGYIHQMALGIDSNHSADSAFLGAEFANARVANFIAGIRDESGVGTQDKASFGILALAKKEKEEKKGKGGESVVTEELEELVHIDGNGTRTVMGKIVDDMFDHTTDKENNRPVIKSAASVVSSTTGGKGGKGGKRKRR